MAKAEFRHSRLRKAIANATAKEGGPGRGIQRAVKFPKATNALRQHVAVVREKDTQATGVSIQSTRLIQAARPQAVVDSRPRALPVVDIRPHPARKLVREEESEVDREILTPVRRMSQLAGIIRHARRLHGLTQEQVALAAGTGRRFVSDVEAGKPTIEFERLLRLCRVLGVTLFALEPGDG